MSITSTRRLAVTGLCTLAAGIGATSTAHAATVSVDLGQGPILSVDTQLVQDAASGVRTSAVEFVQSNLRKVDAGVAAPTASTVQRVLRQTGVTTYVIVDRTGRVVRGPSVVSVHNSRGALDVGWTNDFSGCLQVALSNTAVPQVLDLDFSMPLHTRMLRMKAGRAATSVSLKNITLAVIC